MKSKIARLLMFLFATTFCVVIFCSLSKAAEQKATGFGINCEKRVQTRFRLFQDLKKVGLFIFIPSPYAGAIECHGHEQKCAEEGESHPERRGAYVKAMQKYFDEYPAALHADNLRKNLEIAIKEHLLPLVEPGPSCKTPEIINVKQDELATLSQDMMTIVAKVIISDDPKTRIAVLSLIYYRPDAKHNDYKNAIFGEDMTLIPLSLSPSEMSQFVQQFIDGSTISQLDSM